MPECDYCGESFDTEKSELRHLKSEHADELGAIDQRRVSSLESGSGEFPTGPVAIAAVVVAALGVIAYVTFFMGGSATSASGIESKPLPASGNQTLLQDVQQFPSQGTEHVPSGTDVNYSTMPPTSGTHYDNPASAGFYTDSPPLGQLVHSLEHGAVVIYYDPAQLTPSARESLKEYASVHTDPWASVIVVPHPEENPEAPYVLTAWRHMLRMEEYDARVVRAFLAEYLGRGPENPVR